MCQHRESRSGNCNAFTHDNQTLSCEMAELSFLEDPGVGEEARLACKPGFMLSGSPVVGKMISFFYGC